MLNIMHTFGVHSLLKLLLFLKKKLLILFRNTQMLKYLSLIIAELRSASLSSFHNCSNICNMQATLAFLFQSNITQPKAELLLWAHISEEQAIVAFIAAQNYAEQALLQKLRIILCLLWTCYLQESCWLCQHSLCCS